MKMSWIKLYVYVILNKEKNEWIQINGKKHKITGVNWVLADIPPGLRFRLYAINLAVLCEAADAKRFGYDTALEPTFAGSA